MNVSHPKALAISLGVGIGLSLTCGALFALFGDRDFAWAVGTMLMIIGLIALTMGLLGAAEPEEGWATGVGRNRRQEGRRSLAAQVSEQAPGISKSTSAHLAAWGLIVGGGMIVLSFIAFGLSQ
jgi:hypothetical protein